MMWIALLHRIGMVYELSLKISALTPFRFNHLLQINTDIVDNRNIISKHLSRKGLRLNESGSGCLAINFLERIKKFWKNERDASIAEKDELAICSKTANLSNNHIKSEKEKNKIQNINLKSLREENPDRPIFAQININSIRNKFQFLASQVINNVDVLLVSETKLDDSFPTAQFLLDGFLKPHRLDRCSNGDWLLLYIKDDIPSRLLTDHRLPDNVECLFTEINIRNKKWLLCCSYNPHKNNISNHISHSSKGLVNYISHYDNILLLGHFNSQPSEKLCEWFLQCI